MACPIAFGLIVFSLWKSTFVKFQCTMEFDKKLHAWDLLLYFVHNGWSSIWNSTFVKQPSLLGNTIYHGVHQNFEFGAPTAVCTSVFLQLATLPAV